MTQQHITILGSTGSIGCSTLQVIAMYPEKYRVYALTAFSNSELLLEQCKEFKPAYAVLVNVDVNEELIQRFKDQQTQLLFGIDALEEVAANHSVDTVMAAIVGIAGLKPTLAAASRGKRILLANKESLVVSGQLLIDAVKLSQAILLPVDSEHNAIFQSLPINHQRGLTESGVEKIILTASGGPFLHNQLNELADITPEQACKHPNWSMGKKISVDSATMMNKALELIEACWLFNASPSQIEVLIHPQSIIHSMVAYRDGSVIAQLGCPDMRTPIAHALAYPDRIKSGVPTLDLAKVGSLQFEAVNLDRFPVIRLAYEVVKTGGTASTILNAANEVAVESFLNRRIRFNQITDVIEAVLNQMTINSVDSLDVVLAADQQARVLTYTVIEKNEV
ncbi:1-deoxy-D-xylulose-5-phosphate reductoisomerase [Ferrovum sp. PN-J185]|uniref:1-deoxy-D-xylulose-5-phosphate reductoisomerase n=1 Tax=Ferrovum sp. PN-J185 TaxID=1356306 RepID=UPI00079B9253|nr:1-deoxy-D-xylulose-5-phosphate reductoisomerase [Ferrovum sp. PN-J185]KXW56309.1 1-deoxy-D-xylulose 5-phosphate reductoisomerase [Ferrovum sp. PN-J185]MCC6069033.1 1-deoxy-D-xylulose-5-phosphate reductoisomerase [Ferrovum sp. PN-J185]MDE1890987.1 1-deoxy-D-xylulose-5-phosphate reductoisomerase [Betaproteobacteria bacterium]MDE2055701.1 1-deoxy-D-xylulose-5-phosphate reductoisomerase [Betaproteobacteria bacterium]